MSAPRRVIPGQTLSITRRCNGRRFFLKPSKALNAAILYVVAAACQRFGMELHPLCVMLNRIHLHVTDPHGRFPLFNQVGISTPNRTRRKDPHPAREPLRLWGQRHMHHRLECLRPKGTLGYCS